MHWGMKMDAEQAATIPEAERCGCCGGTGNMLISMFFRCLACNGDGKTRGPVAEAVANNLYDNRFPRKLPLVVASDSADAQP